MLLHVHDVYWKRLYQIILEVLVYKNVIHLDKT